MVRGFNASHCEDYANAARQRYRSRIATEQSLIIVSADCHAGAPLLGYRDYNLRRQVWVGAGA
jgi:hypothetical protein